MRSSSAISRSLGVSRQKPARRPPERKGKRHGQAPDPGRKGDVEGDDPPRKLQPPLQLAHRHLEQQDAEERQREAEQPWRETAASSEQAEHEQEESAEDGRDPYVEVDR